MKKINIKNKISKKLQAELDSVLLFGLSQQSVFQAKYNS
jgi:hypothetical protein